MSSSDEGELTVDVSDVSDPSAHCPVCRQSTFIGETINCEVCELWFHFECVGVKATDDVATREDVPFFCPKCSKRKKKGGSNSQGRKRQAQSKKKAPPAKKKAPPPTAPPPPIVVPPPAALGSPPIKLKFKLGGGSGKSPLSSSVVTSPTTSSPFSSGNERSPKPVGTSTPQRSLLKVAVPATSLAALSPLTAVTTATPATEEPRGPKKRRRSEDEEERWLDAVESGDLNKVIDDPELRSIKDPKLMTARQRAMVERSKGVGVSEETTPPSLEDEGHMALDYGYKKKEDNEHTRRIKEIKSQKRKEIELERREENKKKTMDRLLQKKDSKATKQMKLGSRPARTSVPKVTYRLTLNGASISMPEGYQFPFLAKKSAEDGEEKQLKPTLCSAPGCSNLKKYSCSKSGRPLCSLGCYKANMKNLVVS